MTTIDDDDPRCLQGAETLAGTCARLQPGERALVVSDAATRRVGECVLRAAAALNARVRHETIDGAAMHGEEPLGWVAECMAESNVIFCLTRASMAHTEARRRATDGGARFLSLPDYSMELLAADSLRADFAGLQPLAEVIAAELDRGATLTVRSDLGTDLSLAIAGRRANCCPGICLQPGSMASPPDAEVNIAPLEDSAQGTVWIDGSIPCPEIGLLSEPIGLEIRGGSVARVVGPHATVAAVESLFQRAGTPEARVLAEFGVGLNPRATLSGRMLEDEGCAGTIHLGFGSNATIGGRNRVAFHLDFVVRRPSVWIDNIPLSCVPMRHERERVGVRGSESGRNSLQCQFSPASPHPGPLPVGEGDSESAFRKNPFAVQQG